MHYRYRWGGGGGSRLEGCILQIPLSSGLSHAWRKVSLPHVLGYTCGTRTHCCIYCTRSLSCHFSLSPSFSLSLLEVYVWVGMPFSLGVDILCFSLTLLVLITPHWSIHSYFSFLDLNSATSLLFVSAGPLTLSDFYTYAFFSLSLDAEPGLSVLGGISMTI